MDCNSPLRNDATGEIVTAPSKADGSIDETRDFRSTTNTSQLMKATSNDLPGYETFKYHGDVMGITVIASNVIANFGANMRKYVGGEVGAYVKMLTDGRNVALARMATEAERLGANAVIAMRLDANQISEVMTELIAYGTAVSVRPIDNS